MSGRICGRINCRNPAVGQFSIANKGTFALCEEHSRGEKVNSFEVVA